MGVEAKLLCSTKPSTANDQTPHDGQKFQLMKLIRRAIDEVSVMDVESSTKKLA